MKEIWKDIKDFEGIYQVSNLGNVRSLPRMVKQQGINGKYHIQRKQGKLLKGLPNSKGYLRVTLGSKREKRFIHRLVAEAFIPNPDNKPQVNHKDGNKLNNHVENLEWVNSKENMRHAINNRLIIHKKGESNHSKLTEEQVILVINNCKKGDSKFGVKPLARKLGVSHQTIRNIVDRKKWKHIQL